MTNTDGQQADDQPITKNKASDSSDFDQTVMTMREALLGIADLEEGVLKNIKDHLEKMLDSIYSQNQATLEMTAKDAMVAENPITQVDASLVSGMSTIADELAQKNLEINKLRQSLALFGIDVGTQSIEMLRQQLDELNKRNKILLSLHQQLAKVPIITGTVPRGTTINDIRSMLLKINEEIKSLHTSNYAIKEHIRAQKQPQKPQVETQPTPPSSSRRPK